MGDDFTIIKYIKDKKTREVIGFGTSKFNMPSLKNMHYGRYEIISIPHKLQFYFDIPSASNLDKLNKLNKDANVIIFENFSNKEVKIATQIMRVLKTMLVEVLWGKYANAENNGWGWRNSNTWQ